MSLTNSAEKTIPTSPKKKILLAEDDDSMRRFVEVVLRQGGYEVTAAEDGLAAMQFALETEFDAVVTDAIMPNFTGYDLCRSIRADNHEKHVPCVMLSGLQQEETRENEENIADFRLIKNSNLKTELLSVLEKIFQKSES